MFFFSKRLCYFFQSFVGGEQGVTVLLLEMAYDVIIAADGEMHAIREDFYDFLLHLPSSAGIMANFTSERELNVPAYD